MSKIDTDQGLGPGSERMRREVREAQKELESRSKEKAAEPAKASGNVDKNAVTEPGVGKVERRDDTVDDLLGGFGPSRPDLPRILPKADTTPPPEPVRKELTPTEPGKRQRQRNTFLMIVTFLLVAAGGIAIVKMASNNASSPQPTTTTTTTATVTTTATATATTQATETITPIATMPIETLPTVKTATPTTTSSAKSVHSATTAATTTTTATSPRPTGSAPPGLNLFPDDPHR